MRSAPDHGRRAARRWLTAVALVGCAALAGCAADDDPGAASRASSTTSSASPSQPATVPVDQAALATLCEAHCAPLTLEGISPCGSEAECDANVAEARSRVESLVSAASAVDVDIRESPGFASLFAGETQAHDQYEAQAPCRGETGASDVSSTCFSGVADYLLTVQLIGMGLERMS